MPEKTDSAGAEGSSRRKRGRPPKIDVKSLPVDVYFVDEPVKGHPTGYLSPEERVAELRQLYGRILARKARKSRAGRPG